MSNVHMFNVQDVYVYEYSHDNNQVDAFTFWKYQEKGYRNVRYWCKQLSFLKIYWALTFSGIAEFCLFYVKAIYILIITQF